MTRERILFLVAAIVETILAIPILAAYVFYAATGTSIWWMALALHILALVFAIKAGERRAGSVMGITANIFSWAWIPLLANLLHGIAAVLNFYQAFRGQDPAQVLSTTVKHASDRAEKVVDTAFDKAKKAGKKTADVAEKNADKFSHKSDDVKDAVVEEIEEATEKIGDAVDGDDNTKA